MRLLLTILFLLLPLAAFSMASSIPPILAESEQLLVVLTPNWGSFHGKLLFFQRSQSNLPWEKMAGPLPVVVGKAGLGISSGMTKVITSGPLKNEGDNRSPVGVFKLGPAFGFEAKPSPSMQLNYFPLSDSSFCVDDSHSRYYNQLLNRANIVSPDWNSAEEMHATPLYHWGSFVQYNQNPTQPGKGSCIFLHIWRGQDQGTAGCVAMEEAVLRRLLAQLSAKQKPVIVILTESAYRHMKDDWDLPQLEKALN